MLTRRRGEGRNNLEFGLFSRPMTEITIGTNLSKMFKASEHLKGSHLRLCALLHESYHLPRGSKPRIIWLWLPQPLLCWSLICNKHVSSLAMPSPLLFESWLWEECRCCLFTSELFVNWTFQIDSNKIGHRISWVSFSYQQGTRFLPVAWKEEWRPNWGGTVPPA